MVSPPESPPLLRRTLGAPMGLLVTALVVMIAVEAVDSLLLDESLQQHGIGPRRLAGLEGILWTPFLHSDFGHLGSNAVPLLALGGLVAARGLRYWATITVVVALVGGGLTWLLAGGQNHIGASGIVFGYLGAILAAAIFERRRQTLGAAFLAIGFYSGMLAGLVPQEFISWEGHLFGFLAGVVAARWLAEPPEPRVDRPEEMQPWELDEPWLDG